ncbi:MAG: hypothetical protein EOO48_00720 [Flavobacterium sp.]|nr:MAG: hypothetical protein EOO48_00720 [Flavobacterium sp.]
MTVFAVALFAWNCEKDDICDEATSTTPRLILHFYDAANPTTEKNVTNLSVTAVGSTNDPLTFNGKSQIELPLKTTDDATSYSLILNSTSPTLDNEDLLTFNYARSEVFVSRACGYKVVFQLDPTTPFVHDDPTPADGLWMQSVQVTQPNVQNENEVHISIYF